jgi:hypothetical protein
MAKILTRIVEEFDSNKLLLFFIPFLVYMSNGREISSGDTIPTVFTAISIVKHGTIYLDHLHDYYPYNNQPYFISEQHGHLISNYPLFPAIMALPIIAPFCWLIGPGEGDMVWRYLSSIGGATFTSLAVLLMYLTLRQFIDKKGALILAYAYAFGTALWPIAGQSLWQHGPSLLWWTWGLYALVAADNAKDTRQQTGYIALAGVCAGCAFLCRNINAVGVFFFGVAILWRFRTKIFYFALPAACISLCLIWFNYAFFGNWNGGYEELLKLQWHLDRIDTGRWATPLHIGLAGQLISPSRGILIFSPFLVFAFWGMYKVGTSQEKGWRLLRFTLPIPIIMLLIFSKYSVWWGGNSHYGPRYQIETYPFLLICLGYIWNQIDRSRILKRVFMILLAFSIIIQSIGAFCYPSLWAVRPVPLAFDKGRLWDWSYNQIITCAKEGVKTPFQ